MPPPAPPDLRPRTSAIRRSSASSCAPNRSSCALSAASSRRRSHNSENSARMYSLSKGSKRLEASRSISRRFVDAAAGSVLVCVAAAACEPRMPAPPDVTPLPSAGASTCLRGTASPPPR
eukprot:CAMPEP_0181386562 /NCGR_PEP_ID=MMETSP1106-20121128/23212_1 /TAXON_ID=81844 /ORGANISM="Mantoniella antarctica, Strain SL-175" /LENGTH=119 /DNA_ID=CAMNT_0023506803 /DNA_START=104 /DNA_END=459 /DNA_ORIENTATION=+